MSNVPHQKEFNDIQKLIDACEALCDALRRMRRTDPNQFYDSANEKLLKGIDGSLNGYYQWGVTEEKEVRRLGRQINELNQECGQLEAKIKELEKS